MLIVTSLLVVLLVLLHRAKGGGLSTLFGGGVQSSLSGSTVVEKNLDRLTFFVVGIWVVIDRRRRAADQVQLVPLQHTATADSGQSADPRHVTEKPPIHRIVGCAVWSRPRLITDFHAAFGWAARLRVGAWLGARGGGVPDGDECDSRRGADHKLT